MIVMCEGGCGAGCKEGMWCEIGEVEGGGESRGGAGIFNEDLG